MPGQAGGRDEELLEKHRQGTLTPAEARELARRSLENEELAEALSIEGMLEEGLADPAFRDRWLHLDPPRRNVRWWFALAAATVAATVVLWIRRPEPPSAAPAAIALPPKPASPVVPSLDPNQTSQPILIASRLAANTPETFRGEGGGSRLPYLSHAVTGLAGDEITVGLGSLDGVAHGTQLTVFRKGARIAALDVTAVFRERSRGRVMDGGPVQVGDEVRVDPRVHFDALWERAQALAASGDREAARKMAVKAHQFAGVHSVAPPPDAWQTLAVLELLAGRTAEALTAMHRGMGGAPSAAAINNLAVILETRGDAGEARRVYRQALDAAPPPADRTVIERNLARLEKSP